MHNELNDNQIILHKLNNIKNYSGSIWRWNAPLGEQGLIYHNCLTYFYTKLNNFHWTVLQYYKYYSWYF